MAFSGELEADLIADESWGGWGFVPKVGVGFVGCFWLCYGVLGGFVVLGKLMGFLGGMRWHLVFRIWGFWRC